MRSPVLVAVACVAVALPVAGCGSDENGSGGSADKAPAKTTKSTSGGKQAPAVTMKDIKFTPTELDVKKGTTVTWTNKDSVGHDVHSTDGPGPKFSSGAAGGLTSGDTFKHKFTKAGTYDYVCSVHSGMSGFVIVK
jgi:amicyanin